MYERFYELRLSPLDPAETTNYINHRLRRAALGAPLEFPREVTDAIHGRSRGVPRIINVISDATLVFGYAEERRQVDLPLMREVLAELETTGVLPSPLVSSGAVVGLARESRPQPAQAGPATTVPPAGGSAAYEQELRQAEAASRAAMEQAARRAAEMEQREAALRQRERELAEQGRVLAEEYRLLRVQRAAAVAPMGVPAHGHVRFSRPATDHFTTSRPGFWAWLTRVATGDRAMEGN